jgi:hypothetical protein
MVRVELDDTNRAVALRLAPVFPPGTRLTIAESVWTVGRQQPAAVLASSTEPAQEPIAAGRAYRPRSGRKASGFRIKAVREDHVVTTDGRTISRADLDDFEMLG